MRSTRNSPWIQKVTTIPNGGNFPPKRPNGLWTTQTQDRLPSKAPIYPVHGSVGSTVWLFVFGSPQKWGKKGLDRNPNPWIPPTLQPGPSASRQNRNGSARRWGTAGGATPGETNWIRVLETMEGMPGNQPAWENIPKVQVRLKQPAPS